MSFFYAYPCNPPQIGHTIREAIKKINRTSDTILSWEAMDIIGNLIPEEIYEKIGDRTLVADITHLNCNVVYEIGFAIGMNKPIILTKNIALEESSPHINEVGIFDTIGWLTYQNSDDLYQKLYNETGHVLFEKDDLPLDIKAPVFIQTTLFSTDFSSRIIARLKKSKLLYRSFDPNESPRLSVHEAIDYVAKSYGIIIQYLSNSIKKSDVHNIRASFLAGLAKGIGRVHLIVQEGNGPVPLDYKDFTLSCKKKEDLDPLIATFAGDVVDALQNMQGVVSDNESTLLQKLDLGASAAENEMRSLQNYYLKTESFHKASRGEVQLIIGRKGSGKSAIFLQIRDKERSKGKNIVLDLKPEGYKLIKFKEQVLDFLEEGTFQHTIMAFWEYLLLLEISHKILEQDQNKYKTNTNLYDQYIKLEEQYKAADYYSEGDFSERMGNLINSIEQNYKAKYGQDQNVRMQEPQITGLIYSSDIKKLREELVGYLKHKESIWLLFDNIDKGWPASGLVHEDLIMIRTLIDASRKIQRYFERNKTQLFPIIFLRNDVYDLLVGESPDRQKEAKELLDWTDTDLLKEIIRLRIVANIDNDTTDFNELWRKICIPLYHGEDSFQYIVERSLMRPRFLINLINQCKSIAVNLNHSKITEEDINKGFKAYSADLLTDISYELRDINQESENILYSFIGSKSELKRSELESVLSDYTKSGNIDKLIELLLWYGFLGIRVDSSSNKEVQYIYDMNYSMQIMNGYLRVKQKEITFMINPAFWPSLMINE